MDTAQRFAIAAQLRGDAIKKERRKRVIQRNKRLQSMSASNVSANDDNDPESKLRSVFAAIRSHNNSDVELNTSMTASQLFHAVVEALSGAPAQKAASESRALGEALDLVNRLNALLQAR